MYERPTQRKDQIRMVFHIGEYYNYETLDDAFVCLKLCQKLGLKIILSFDRIVKLFDPVIPTNDYAMQIEASGDEKLIEQLRKEWDEHNKKA